MTVSGWNTSSAREPEVMYIASTEFGAIRPRLILWVLPMGIICCVCKRFMRIFAATELTGSVESNLTGAGAGAVFTFELVELGIIGRVNFFFCGEVGCLPLPLTESRSTPTFSDCSALSIEGAAKGV